MASIQVATWKDLVDHLMDFLGAHPGGEARRDARRSIFNSMRELTTGHNWSYYYRQGRIVTSAPYLTGTVSYDHTGGTYERLVTLTGGSFPAWAAQGRILIGTTIYEVADRKSATEITLAIHSNPGADVASTSYTLYRDAYPLPVDCRSIGMMIIDNFTTDITFEHPSSMLSRQRVWRGTATPRFYSVLGSPDFLGTLQLGVFPPPDQAYGLSFVYQRRPRQLAVEDHHQGKISTTAGSASVTGSGTAFTSKLQGSVLRISQTAELPTAPWGSNPPAVSRIVVAVNSATSLTLDDTVSETMTNVPYLISDPVDIEDGAMMTALLRCCERQMGVARSKEDRQILEKAWIDALILAREADSRSFKDENVGGQQRWPYRLANFPLGGDRS